MTRFDDCRWQFPAPHDWPTDDDVIAVGADLEPDTLLYAYSHGFFPMHLDRRHSMLGWWSPLKRGIIPPDGLRVSRSMRRSARDFVITFDTAFREVMIACGTVRSDGNWITDEFIDAYTRLHDAGHAHSVEARDGDGHLVGGLYGVRIDRFFAGESMFHTATDASKVALMHLVDWLRATGATLLDTQWCTEHLAGLGCIEVDRAEYLELLGQSID